LLDRVPAELPDLFSGEELVVFARYAGEASGEIILEGSRNGRRERFSAPVRFPEHETANAWVAPLWASQRIGELTRQARLEGGSQALISEIKALGLRYGIITEYTSYLVQEPQRPQLAREGQLRLDEVVVTGTAAAAPAAQSGADAFRRAEKSAKLADAKTIAAAEEGREPQRGQGRAVAQEQAGGWQALRGARRGLDGCGSRRYRAGRGRRPLQPRLVRAHAARCPRSCRGFRPGNRC
jgi:hypothetical protein